MGKQSCLNLAMSWSDSKDNGQSGFGF